MASKTYKSSKAWKFHQNQNINPIEERWQWSTTTGSWRGFPFKCMFTVSPLRIPTSRLRGYLTSRARSLGPPVWISHSRRWRSKSKFRMLFIKFTLATWKPSQQVLVWMQLSILSLATTTATMILVCTRMGALTIGTRLIRVSRVLILLRRRDFHCL